MFTNYLMIFLFFILLTAFIVINSLSIVQYEQGLNIRIDNTKPKCQYNNQNLDSAQQCTGDNSKKFVSDKGIIYLINNFPTQYIQVCKELCTGAINTGGKCSKQNKQYKECINFLKPSSDCTGVAKPVSYISGDYYYASQVLTKSC
jgi:hypothetical protein